jgi:hypothetical protein
VANILTQHDTIFQEPFESIGGIVELVGSIDKLAQPFAYIDFKCRIVLFSLFLGNRFVETHNIRHDGRDWWWRQQQQQQMYQWYYSMA